jgi:hypothetical protein
MAVLWLCGFGSLLAVILGLKARREIAESKGALGGDGLAIGGIAFGFGGLALAILGWAAFLIAGPVNFDLGAARLAAETHNELTSTLQEGQAAQEAYRRKHGEYAETGWALRDVGFSADNWLSVYAHEGGYCMQVADRRYAPPVYMHIADDTKVPTDGRCT